MNYMSLEDFKNTKDYEKFINDNPGTSTLKVQVFTPFQAMPIPNTKIYVIKEINDNNVVFFEGITDESGIIDNIKLPAPGGTYNMEKMEIPQCITYEIVALNDDYETLDTYKITMFSNVKAIQDIKMSLKEGNNNA